MRVKILVGGESVGEIGVGPDGRFTFAPARPHHRPYLERLARSYAQDMFDANGQDPTAGTAEDVLRSMLELMNGTNVAAERAD